MKAANQFILSIVIAATATNSLAADSYYKEEPQFHMWPKATDARFVIDRVGPIGLGLELIQPAFTMRIRSVEAGSPAGVTGHL